MKNYKKIRKVWTINPKTRVKPLKKKEVEDYCKGCTNTDINICEQCVGENLL